jgi:hypothetical protein
LKKITLIVFVSLVAISAQVGATKPMPGFPFGWNFVSVPGQSQGMNVALGFTFRSAVDSIRGVVVKVEPKDGIVYEGPASWTVEFQHSGDSAYRVLNLTLPQDDTSEICVNLAYNGGIFPVSWYFVTEGDSVEYFAGDPRQLWMGRDIPKQTSSDLDIDTLKESDWNVQYEVYLDARTPEKLSSLESLLNRKLTPDPKGRVKVKISLRQIYELTKKGVKGGWAVPPPWYHGGRDKTLHIEKSDSLEGHSSLLH